MKVYNLLLRESQMIESLILAIDREKPKAISVGSFLAFHAALW